MIVRILKALMAALFCINTIFLSISLLSPYYNPKYVWVPSLFGLFFKPFMVVHVLFMLLFMIAGFRRLFVFAFLVFIFSLVPIMNTVGFHFWKNKINSTKHLKLMTYNVNSFDFYKKYVSIYEIMNSVRVQNPDIICFQEYLANRTRRKAVINQLEKLGYHYYYEYTTEIIKPHNNVGQAIFSKLPFYNVQPISFYNTSNGAFSVDIPFQGDTIRLFNVHFQSISLDNDEIKLPKTINDVEEPDNYYYESVLMKLREAFRKRSFQVLKVKEYIDISPYKIILCGDFNDTPSSFLYRQLTEKLNDSFLYSSIGLGSTFSGKIPFQRIDYVLMDPSFKIGKTKVIHVPGSDHYPVVSTFSLP